MDQGCPERNQGLTVWFTGPPGAGKTTLAQALASRMRRQGRQVEVLDGDEVRKNLSAGLGFSREDRDTNVRRLGFVCGLLSRNGVDAITAAVSPYRETRDEVRASLGRFVEVHVHCPLEVLVSRDTKGMYRKALDGEIDRFTGVSDPYEEPLSPEITVHTHMETVQESLSVIVDRLVDMGYLGREATPI